jgi:hypothetical protein
MTLLRAIVRDEPGLRAPESVTQGYGSGISQAGVGMTIAAGAAPAAKGAAVNART